MYSNLTQELTQFSSVFKWEKELLLVEITARQTCKSWTCNQETATNQYRKNLITSPSVPERDCICYTIRNIDILAFSLWLCRNIWASIHWDALLGLSNRESQNKRISCWPIGAREALRRDGVVLSPLCPIPETPNRPQPAARQILAWLGVLAKWIQVSFSFNFFLFFLFWKFCLIANTNVHGSYSHQSILWRLVCSGSVEPSKHLLLKTPPQFTPQTPLIDSSIYSSSQIRAQPHSNASQDVNIHSTPLQ